MDRLFWRQAGVRNHISPDTISQEHEWKYSLFILFHFYRSFDIVNADFSGPRKNLSLTNAVQSSNAENKSFLTRGDLGL